MGDNIEQLRKLVDAAGYLIHRHSPVDQLRDKYIDFTNEIEQLSSIENAEQVSQTIRHLLSINSPLLKQVIYMFRDLLIAAGIALSRDTGTSFEWTLDLTDPTIIEQSTRDDMLAMYERGDIDGELATDFVQCWESAFRDDDGDDASSNDSLEKISGEILQHSRQQNWEKEQKRMFLVLPRPTDLDPLSVPEDLGHVYSMIMGNSPLAEQSRSHQLFGGAGLIVELSSTERTKRFIENQIPVLHSDTPGHRVIITPHAHEVSWLIYKLKESAACDYDHMSKYVFFARLANAANTHRIACGDEKNPLPLLQSIFMAGLAWFRENPAGRQAA
jgi:hypothetical protein